MKHYLKSKDGDGACSECKYGMATLSLKDFYEIMKYAKIGFIQ